MKTEVVMERKLFGSIISQKSKSGFFSATDLVKAGNDWRRANKKDDFKLASWLQSKSVKEFISALEDKYGKVKINSRGKNSHTWVHPLLFIDMALAISPELKLEVYEWLFDHLIKFRNDSGSSYKKMCGALYELSSNKFLFQKFIQKACLQIQMACGVSDWQKATEDQLELRDKIHNNIALLTSVLRNSEQAVKLGIADATRNTKL